MARERERPPRILIVEDDGLVALHEEDLVRSLGCEVVGPVGRIEDALRVVETARIEGAVLDIHLDGNATSYPLAAELENRGIPFIFVTGLDKADMAKLFPAALVICPPSAPAAFRAAVRRSLANRKSAAARPTTTAGAS